MHRRARSAGTGAAYRFAVSTASANASMQPVPGGPDRERASRSASCWRPAPDDDHLDGDDHRRRAAATSGPARRSPATTTAEHAAAGRGSGPAPSVKPRQDHIATQVVRPPRSGERRRRRRGRPRRAVTGSPPRRRCVRRRRRTARGLRAAAAELLPDAVEPVARAERRPRASPAGSGAAAAPPGAARRARPRRRRRARSPAPSRRGAASGAAPGGRWPRRCRRPPTVRPPWPPSVEPAGVELGVVAAWTTARASSSGPVLRSASRKCQALLRVLAGGGDQPHGEAAVAEVDRDRGGGGDRRLQRGGDALAAVGAQPVVEEEGRARLPGLLLAAHHQLADARRAAPVHPAQVVAAAVLADGDVLGAAGGERPRPVVAGAGPGAAERDRRAAAPCAA